MIHDTSILATVDAFAGERLLSLVLIQLLIVMLAARICGGICRSLGQPSVVGEIGAGLLLGPSLLGRLLPEVSQKIFDPVAAEVFGVLGQLGLILLLFLVGLEFDFNQLRVRARAAIAISLTGLVLPFALGASLGLTMLRFLKEGALGETAAATGFVLFMGIAAAITAMPILGRLLLETNLTRTRIGTITLSAAAFGDACGWILLAAIASFVQAEYAVGLTLQMVAKVLVFAGITLWVVRPALKQYVRRALAEGQGSLGVDGLAVIYGLLFLFALATSLIGIFAIFGAFALGTALSDEPAFRKFMTAHLRDLLSVIFLPVFFAYTGLRTDIGTLDSWLHWGLFFAVLACAILGKLGGCALAARWSGFSPRESLCIGALMNTRGLMELIVINVGRDLGVLPDSVFCMLVLMALATTVMTTPLLLRFVRGTEFEPLVQQSELRRPPGVESLVCPRA